MKLTILTPTYNRAYSLPKLYDSLLIQTNKNFEWVVVDDGSTDKTEELIKNYINKNNIEIKYMHKKNGGKHTALNYAIKNLNSDMVLIVDSDDFLLENAVDIINEYYEKYKTKENINGFSFLKQYPDGKINGKLFPKDELNESYIDCRLNRRIDGDKAEVFYTNILKQYPFLEVKGEKFLFEDYVWVKMAEKYNTIHINKPIYVAEYLNDGLTKNIFKAKINSPKGNSKRGLVLCSSKCKIKPKVKGIMIYISYGIYSGDKIKDLYKNAKNKEPIFILCLIPAIFYYIYLIIKKQTLGGDK